MKTIPICINHKWIGTIGSLRIDKLIEKGLINGSLVLEPGYIKYKNGKVKLLEISVCTNIGKKK